MCRLHPVQTWSAHPPPHLDPQLFCPIPFLRSIFFLFFFFYFSLLQTLSGGEQHGALTPAMTHNVSTCSFSGPPLSSAGVAASHTSFRPVCGHLLVFGLSGRGSISHIRPVDGAGPPGDGPDGRHLAQGMPSPPWHLSREGDRPAWSTHARHSPGSEGRAVHRERALSGGTAFQGQQPVKGWVVNIVTFVGQLHRGRGSL